MIRYFFIAAALLGCTAAAPVPSFNPLDFFTGETRGVGSLKVIMKPAVPIRVSSEGHPDGNGGIVLHQTIHEGVKPPRQNRWSLRPTSATTLTGSASNSPGPVRGRMNGNRLQLSYAMKGGMKADQTLTLQPGGERVVSRMSIKRLGITVARVEEVITKVE
ncbi:MAG: DUF3833 family protein [Sphingomicrobium sp.]